MKGHELAIFAVRWLVAVYAISGSWAAAATLNCTSFGNGGWNAGIEWNCNKVPNNGPTNIYNATVDSNLSLGGGVGPISPTINTLVVSSAKQLDFSGQSLTISGVTASSNAGTITSTSGSGQTLLLGSSGATFATTGTISNLTISAVSGAAFNLNGATLSSVELTGAGTFSSTGTSTLSGVANNALLTIASGTTTITGPSANTGTWSVAAGATGAISNAFLTGGTLAGAGTFTSTAITTLSGVANNALLTILSGTSISGTSANTGTWSASTGGTVVISNASLTGGTFAGPGTFSVTGSNTLSGVANNGLLTIASGTTTLTGTSANTGTWSAASRVTGAISNASLTGGALAGTGAFAASGDNTLSGVKNNTLLTIASGTTTLSGTSANTGTWSAATGATGAIFNASLTGGTLTGPGAFTASGNNTLSGVTNNAPLTIVSGTTTISGTSANTGTWSAATGATGAIFNASLTGGTLIGAGAFNATGNNTLSGVKNNALLTIASGTTTLSGTIANSGTYSAATGSQVSLANLTLNGGTLSGASQFIASGSVSLKGVTLAAGAALNQGNASLHDFSVTGGTLTGTGNYSGSNTLSGTANNGTVNLTGTLTITGAGANAGGTYNAASGGTIAFNAANLTGGTYNAAAGATIVFNAANLTGGTYTGATGATIAFNAANLTGGTFSGARAFDLSGANTLQGITNSATLSIVGGTSTFSGTNINLGALAVLTGATLSLNGFILDGSLTTAGTGVIQTNGASSLLAVSNAGAANYSIDGYLAETGSDWNMGAGNTTAVHNGGSLVISGAVVNSGGALTIDAGAEALASSYTQNSGTTTVDGTLQIGTLSNPGAIDITGGTFEYSGSSAILGDISTSGSGTVMLDGDSTIYGNVALGAGSLLKGNHGIYGNFSGSEAADVVNGGVISPGHSPGVVNIIGDYSQTSTGELDIQLAGTDPSQYDRLIVTGTAMLDGTLDITLLDGFVPVSGDVFQFLSAGAIAGNFSNVELPSLSPDNWFTVSQTANGFDIEVQSPEPGGAMGVAFTLLALALYRKRWQKAMAESDGERWGAMASWIFVRNWIKISARNWSKIRQVA